MAYRCVNGKDSCGNKAYISIKDEDGKIYVSSSEEYGDVVFTKKQAKELIQVLQDFVNKNK